MLNADLFTKEELIKLVDKIPVLEATIKRLEDTIEAFKKYDAERKAYYKQSLITLGEQESYIQELEAIIDSDTDKKEVKALNKKVQELLDCISHYKTIIKAYEDKERLIPELVQLQFYKEGYLKQKDVIKDCTRAFRIAIKSKKTLINKLRSDRNELICKLNHETNKTFCRTFDSEA